MNGLKGTILAHVIFYYFTKKNNFNQRGLLYECYSFLIADMDLCA